MSVIQTMTLRQMRAERTRTRLTLLELTIASGLLTAVLLGGMSLAATVYPTANDPSAWEEIYEKSFYAQLILSATAVVAVLLLFATSFLIRSAFAVSLSQRVRALGQLASVGATRRQLRASVYWEALLLGAVAIPAGMLFAALGLWITFSALNRVQVMPLFIGTIHLSVSPLGLLFCMLWSALMLFLAARRPARTAFRIEPIETFSPARRARRTRRARLWRMEKPPEPQLARRSQAQNRARHRTLCAGMAVSMALIVVSAGFSSGMRYAYQAGKQPYDCRWYVWGYGGTHPQEMLAQAARLFPDTPGLRIELYTSYFAADENEKILTCEILFILEDEDFAAWYGKLLTPEEDKVPIVLSQNDSIIPENVSWDALQGRLPLVYWSFPQQPEGICTVPLPMHAGEHTSIIEFSSDVYIAAVTNRTAFEYAFRLRDRPTDHDRSFAVYYGTDDGAQLEQPLMDLAASYLTAEGYNFNTLWQDFTPTSEWAVRRAGITILVNVFSWGFTVLVFLAVSVSLIGTMSADFALRRREFALLRSAGMEQRQMDRFLRRQCLSYCAGLPFGILLGAVPCYLFSRILMNVPFRHVFSLPVTILGAAILVGVCVLALHGARKNIARLSVAEALRGQI